MSLNKRMRLLPIAKQSCINAENKRKQLGGKQGESLQKY